MNRLRRTLIAAPLFICATAAYNGPAASQLAVFDAPNYQQNLLVSSRALEQINNQVRQLENQVQVMLRLDQNLRALGPTIGPDLQRALTGLQTELRAGDGLAIRLDATQNKYEQLFPKQTSAALSSDDVSRNAASRWDEEYGALRRAAVLQGQIADNIDGDARLLADGMARSKNAVGALEVAQAGNELISLGVKQSLQLQSLFAAQDRAQTFARARELATENEARQRFKIFLGSGSGYLAAR